VNDPLKGCRPLRGDLGLTICFLQTTTCSFVGQAMIIGIG
jgi:hypothetical protein